MYGLTLNQLFFCQKTVSVPSITKPDSKHLAFVTIDGIRGIRDKETSVKNNALFKINTNFLVQALSLLFYITSSVQSDSSERYETCRG